MRQFSWCAAVLPTQGLKASDGSDGQKQGKSWRKVRTWGTVMSMPNSEPVKKLRYEAVQDLVLGLIADQNMAPGDKLPSSSELAQSAKVSLISVRRALDELERAGRIQRHQGLGTFVSQPRILSEPSKLGDLLETLGNQTPASELTTELISVRVGLPGSSIAQMLRIAEGAPVWEIVRGRRVGGLPAIVERAILPLQLVPALDEKLLAEGGSLYKYLAKQYSIHDHSEEQYLEVTLPGSLERNWLNLAARELAVTVKGVSFTEAGTPFDCFQQTYPARKFVFYVSGSREHQLLAAPHSVDWTISSLRGN